jgi:hypothetical protein
LEALRELAVINRGAVRRANAEAKRLGSAGAWAAVLLAVAGMLASLAISNRLRRHFLEPLSELHQVISAARQGDAYRRVQTGDAAAEMREILDWVNDVLDKTTPPGHAGPDSEIGSPKAVPPALSRQPEGV